MSEFGNGPLCAWVRLYSPRGPQVTLPLPAGPKEALEALHAALDIGWLVNQPGLEEGEEKETVGFVLRGVQGNESKETPFVVLYSTNDAMKWPFLKVYLNTEADVQAFEFASKMTLAKIPEYTGQDKPQRGARADRWIVKVPKPFQVVFKKNPKHDPSTEEGKMKPSRLFVRWAEQAPQAPVVAEAERSLTDEEFHALNALCEKVHSETGERFSPEGLCRWKGLDNVAHMRLSHYRLFMDFLNGKLRGGTS